MTEKPEIAQSLKACLDSLTWHAAAASGSDNEEAVVDARAVLCTANAMLEKMRIASEKGRGGWYDPTRCTIERLAALFFDHLLKGDLVDVLNLAMMLRLRQAEMEPEAFQEIMLGNAKAFSGDLLQDEYAFMEGVYKDAEAELRKQVAGRLSFSDSPTLQEFANAEDLFNDHMTGMLRQLKGAVPAGMKLRVQLDTVGENDVSAVIARFMLHTTVTERLE